MKSFRLDRSVSFLVAILVILVGTGVALMFAMRTDPLKESLSGDKLLKALIVLEDGGIPLSTNILVYYPESKRAAMFDIPGETGLIIKSLGRVDRIDAVYRERGIDEFKTEIEGLTGVKVPFTIRVKLDDFVRLTDLLGGLDVFIPTPVDLATDDGKILLPSGAVTLDGDKIRTYVTYADPLDQEGESASRKQKAVLALFRAFSDHSGTAFADNFWPLVESCLDSNLDGDRMKSLVAEFSRIDAERLVPQRVTGSLREVDGKLLLFPFYDGQLLRDIIGQTLGGLASEGSALQERIYALEILNGTKSQGLARNTSELYQGFGYDVIRTGNAEAKGADVKGADKDSDKGEEYDKTVIIDRIGNRQVAEVIAKVIQCDNIETASLEQDGGDANGNGMEATVDFTIIIGKDFDGRYVR
jgi:polyisoprenyl-teichoic acid--peptidoglycan teichoic acid transferase